MELHMLTGTNGPAQIKIAPRATKHLGLDLNNVCTGIIGHKE